MFNAANKKLLKELLIRFNKDNETIVLSVDKHLKRTLVKMEKM